MPLKIIAEIGWNFMGDMKLAEEMIIQAKASGANVAKFQYWNPSRLKAGPWDTDGRREIYENAKLDKEKINFLENICKQNEIDFLISAFNVVDAKFLKSLGINSIKIPSHEVANFELHEYVATHFDQAYVSLGAGTVEEVKATIDVYNALFTGKDWVGMHCVSSYPCPSEKANLPRINFLKRHCKVVGYSDHTSDLITPVVAASMGAKVIEKHFTIDKDLPGRDNKFALDALEFKHMVDNIRMTEFALIEHGDGPMDIETDTMENYRGRWGENF